MITPHIGPRVHGLYVKTGNFYFIKTGRSGWNLLVKCIRRNDRGDLFFRECSIGSGKAINGMIFQWKSFEVPAEDYKSTHKVLDIRDAIWGTPSTYAEVLTKMDKASKISDEIKGGMEKAIFHSIPYPHTDNQQAQAQQDQHALAPAFDTDATLGKLRDHIKKLEAELSACRSLFACEQKINGNHQSRIYSLNQELNSYKVNYQKALTEIGTLRATAYKWAADYKKLQEESDKTKMYNVPIPNYKDEAEYWRKKFEDLLATNKDYIARIEALQSKRDFMAGKISNLCDELDKVKAEHKAETAGLKAIIESLTSWQRQGYSYFTYGNRWC